MGSRRARAPPSSGDKQEGSGAGWARRGGRTKRGSSWREGSRGVGRASGRNSQKKNGAALPRVPATRGLEGSEGFRGLEGCRPAAAHGRGSTGDGARDRGTGDGE